MLPLEKFESSIQTFWNFRDLPYWIQNAKKVYSNNLATTKEFIQEQFIMLHSITHSLDHFRQKQNATRLVDYCLLSFCAPDRHKGFNLMSLDLESFALTTQPSIGALKSTIHEFSHRSVHKCSGFVLISHREINQWLLQASIVIHITPHLHTTAYTSDCHAAYISWSLSHRSISSISSWRLLLLLLCLPVWLLWWLLAVAMDTMAPSLGLCK